MIKLTTLLTEAVTVPELIKQADEKWGSIAAQYPIWPLMMEWWAKHPTEKFTTSSLEILVAGGDKNISAVKQAKVDQQAYADKLKVLIDSITVMDAKRTNLENCYKLISAYLKAGAVISPAIGMAWDHATQDIPTDKAAYDSKTETQVAAAYKKLKSYYSDQRYVTGEFTLTEDVLGRLLNQLTSKVQAKMAKQHEKSWFVNFSFERMVQEAISIKISKGKEVSSSSATKVKGQSTAEPVYEEYTIQFPPEGAANRNQLASNFMRDNKTGASSDAVKMTRANLIAMKEQIASMKKDPKYQNLKISYINVTAYAQTSCVHTKWTRRKGSTGASTKEKNIDLAKKRGEDIIDFGVEQITAIFNIDESKIIKTAPITKPNVGPDWSKIGGTYADGTPVTIKNYGPKYQKAYAQNPNLTPQAFYNQRFNPGGGLIEAEYQEVFGPMRMSLLGIKIGLEYNAVQETTGDEFEFEAAYSNNFTASITWKAKKKFKINWGALRIKRSAKRSVFQPRWTGPTECPLF